MTVDPLPFISIADLARKVDTAPPAKFLALPVWSSDAYGVIVAEKKAGKTWSVADLAVSFASCTPWLGMFEIETPGQVVVFFGEGGERKMLRRLRAVAESKNVPLEALPIELCFKGPARQTRSADGADREKIAALDPC